MRFIALAIVIFAAYSAYNEFFSKPKEFAIGPYIEPELQEAVYKVRSDIDAIRSGISRDAKRNSFSGKAPYPELLTKDPSHLFDNVLITPILPSTQGWQKKTQNSYSYTYAPGKSVDFKYNSANGEFECISDYDTCELFR